MKKDFYLPMLKSKDGEFTALSKLNIFTKQHICPLFEVAPLEWDNETNKKPKTLKEHLHNFCHKKFLKKWCSENAFIDPVLLDGQLIDGHTSVEYIYDQLNSTFLIPMTPVPVVHMSSSLQQKFGLKNVMVKYKISEMAIRMGIDEIMDIKFDEKVIELIEEFGIKTSNVHLIFDLGSSDFNEYHDFADGIVAQLESFPRLSEWKSFTICGGAFPASNLLKKGSNTVIRLEWRLFNLVKKGILESSYARPINYGDYSVVTPGYFEFDPKKMSRSANIRYTYGDYWLVYKGSALKKPEDYKQYVSLAGEVFSSEHYLGQAYSEGDQYIKNCYFGTAKTGNPTTWNWVGNNHHFTKVVFDLFSNHSYS